jgi:hypothetical protein
LQTISRRLTGARCKCSGCAEYFNSVSVFDAHRVGGFGPERRCLSIGEMLAKGWIRNSAQFWIRGHRSNFAVASDFAPKPARHAQETRSAQTLSQGAGSWI